MDGNKFSQRGSGMWEGLVDGLRQLKHPREFRIRRPRSLTVAEQLEIEAILARDDGRGSQDRKGDPVADQGIAELATCLWYLKTKYFKRAWSETEPTGDDPRTRRALARINKSLEALRTIAVEVHDPTNERYSPGGEATMRPIQFAPTAGLLHETVSETVAPIVYRHDRLIQRGEVFVSVPIEGARKSDDGRPSVIDKAGREELGETDTIENRKDPGTSKSDET